MNFKHIALSPLKSFYQPNIGIAFTFEEILSDIFILARFFGSVYLLAKKKVNLSIIKATEEGQ